MKKEDDNKDVFFVELEGNMLQVGRQNHTVNLLAHYVDTIRNVFKGIQLYILYVFAIVLNF